MMIAVTGASGLAGRPIVAELRAHGYEVRAIDLHPYPNDDVPYKLVDLTDIGQCYGALAGCDAVIHMAAIPRPLYHTNDVVFRTNILSTYNILEAAATLGISRLVLASSISVLGFPFFEQPLEPEYVPIDELHPRKPQDPYALSKYLGEEMAEAFVRRTGMSVVSLRLAWIHTAKSFREQLMPLWGDPAAGASNLWSYIDARDSARACRLALEVAISGHEACFLSAENSFMKDESSADLVARYYPSTKIRDGFDGHRSLLSGERAAQLLGFVPEHRWQEYFNEGEL